MVITIQENEMIRIILHFTHFIYESENHKIY